MSEPIRILHVIGIMNRGGAETMIMNLYRNIDRTKVQFDFVENSAGPAVFDEEILSLGGRIYRCPHYNGRNHVAYTRWWREFFRVHPSEYPIVHGHLGSTAAIYLSIAKKYGCHTVAHSHNVNKMRSLGDVVYGSFSYPTRFVADRFFACSREAGISRYGRKIGKNEEQCIVLRNAIDTAQFAFDVVVRKKMRTELNLAEDQLVIGNISRFSEQKNHMFLLDIFAEIRKKNPCAMLLLVGDGDLRPRIEQKITDLGLTDAVILTGVRSNTWDYYQAMDVFLMPSFYEGLPVSMVEAQTAGLPCCVSANVPKETALTDLVEFIPLEKGAAHWEERILKRTNESRRDMGAEIARAGYDIATTSKWLEDFYLKVVTERG